ncbi:hypothetical protein [Fictibacillus sp. S7]|uniref:hypothetical protein n=1 Tax=Fictibacillus sp. S7 TaxID=2212476 RepID=UPI0010133A37|nr:hypothetical protein [Fictibacillus sp. S7]RXZ01427.1 hypothetical protein DMO16_18245 [Fictibacillus sp. S7]
MANEEEKLKAKLNAHLDRINKQHDTIRKLQDDGGSYKHLDKKDTVTVYTNDKKAMKFWEE